MKYEAIEKYRKQHSVKLMCEVLNVLEASYYRWKKSQEKREKKQIGELKIVAEVEKIFNESDKTYGYRVIKEALKQKNIVISEYKVRKIMRENGLYPEVKKKYRPNYGKKGDGRYKENIVNQNFKTSKSKEVWASDITYIKTTIGWVYLAVVIDLYNREVVGYSVSKKIDTELVKAALSNAVGRFGTREGLIVHTDRGSQYASKGFEKMLEEYGMIGSMSKGGCPYDNSCVESFFATMKKERIYRRDYDTIEDVKRDVFEYIEMFYNRKRLHSVLGYMSPVEYRLKYDVENIA